MFVLSCLVLSGFVLWFFFSIGLTFDLLKLKEKKPE
jgi:hypothetical protein